MKRDGIGKHFVLAFSIALILYLAAYFGIEHLRGRKGPWQVTFITDADLSPKLTIRHDGLGITNVAFVFEGEKGKAAGETKTIPMEPPFEAIPFGELVFFDTTFLPGTVTFQIFGHEIELLPRVLVLNKKEVAWENNKTFRLTPGDKVAVSAAPQSVPKRNSGPFGK